MKFFIKERDFKESISSKNNIADWTLENEHLLRPYGPGIMYEMVFYLAHHLGFGEIITVGWDNKLVGSDPAKQHFYDIGDKFCKSDFIEQNEVADNVPMKTLSHEAKITTDCIKVWHKWLRGQGCELKICSPVNPAPKSISRVEI